MADVPETGEQASVELPNGVTFTGMGGDLDTLREQAEERHEERTGKPIEAAVETPQGEAAPKQTRGQKRFAELTREREDANRRAEAAEARIKELEAKPAAQAQSATQPREDVRPAAAVTPAVRAKPTTAEIGTKYATYDDYVEDLSAWGTERVRAELRTEFDARLKETIEADRASRGLQSHVQNVFEQGRKTYQDFDAVIAKNPRPIPPLHQTAILSAPNPEQLMYALAQDDAKLQEIITIGDPIRLGFALAAIAPAKPVALPASTAPAVRTTNAPAPPQPVGAGTRTAKKTLQEYAADGDMDGYRAARAAGQTS